MLPLNACWNNTNYFRFVKETCYIVLFLMLFSILKTQSLPHFHRYKSSLITLQNILRMAMDYQREIFQTDDSELSIMMKIYNISDRMFEESLERLKDWYRLQPHFPKEVLDDRCLKRMIAVNGFSVEKAKFKLDSLFLIRSKLPEFFSGRDSINAEIKQLLDIVDIPLLPQLTENHCRVTVLNIRDSDPDLFDPTMLFKVIYMICDLEIWFDTMTGIHLIWDCTHTRLAQILKITPVMVKKFLFVFQKCYGAKLKSVHLINAPSYASTLMSAAKLVLKKKLAERIYTHNSVEDLHKHISPKYLPKELGGNQKSYAEISEKMKEAFQSKDIMDILNHMNKFKTDESKRINSSGTVMDDLLGITGTFRKLEVD